MFDINYIRSNNKYLGEIVEYLKMNHSLHTIQIYG